MGNGDIQITGEILQTVYIQLVLLRTEELCALAAGRAAADDNDLVAGNTHDQRICRTDCLARYLYDLAGKADAVFQAAAVPVGTLVVQGGEELRHDVAVCCVERNGVKAGALCVDNYLYILLLHGVDIVDRHRMNGILCAAGGNIGRCRFLAA